MRSLHAGGHRGVKLLGGPIVVQYVAYVKRLFCWVSQWVRDGFIMGQFCGGILEWCS